MYSRIIMGCESHCTHSGACPGVLFGMLCLCLPTPLWFAGLLHDYTSGTFKTHNDMLSATMPTSAVDVHGSQRMTYLW